MNWSNRRPQYLHLPEAVQAISALGYGHRLSVFRLLVRAVVAETLGTAMLLAIVVGSGITGERLSAGNFVKEDGEAVKP